jgi:predicted DNA-binding transcriptional regulator AlpA
MLDPPGLTTPEIAEKYGRTLNTVQTDWTQRGTFPPAIDRRGKHKVYDAEAVAQFVRENVARTVPELEAERLYTAADIEEATGIKRSSIRAAKSRGAWPDPDNTTGRADRWFGRTVTAALANRRGYRHRASNED